MSAVDVARAAADRASAAADKATALANDARMQLRERTSARDLSATELAAAEDAFDEDPSEASEQAIIAVMNTLAARERAVTRATERLAPLRAAEGASTKAKN